MQYPVEYEGEYYFNPTYIHEEGKSEPVLIYKNVVYFTVDNRGVHHYHQTYSGEFQDPEQIVYTHIAPQPYYIRSQFSSMLALPAGESLGITADTNTTCPSCKEAPCPDENKKVSSLMQFIQNPEKQFLSKSKFSQYNDVNKSNHKLSDVFDSGKDKESASKRDEGRSTNAIVPFKQRNWRRPPVQRKRGWENSGSPYEPLFPALCSDTLWLNNLKFSN